MFFKTSLMYFVSFIIIFTFAMVLIWDSNENKKTTRLWYILLIVSLYCLYKTFII